MPLLFWAQKPEKEYLDAQKIEQAFPNSTEQFEANDNLASFVI